VSKGSPGSIEYLVNIVQNVVILTLEYAMKISGLLAVRLMTTLEDGGRETLIKHRESLSDILYSGLLNNVGRGYMP
ncbi:hypothetical protein L9F63_004583, partial [Diploptera punctata]